MSLLKTNIDFPGKDVNLFIQKVFADTYFHTKFGATILSAIKGKMVYHDIDDSMTLEAYAVCPTTAGGDVTLNQRNRALCSYMMTGEFDHTALIDTFVQSQYANGFRNEKFNDTEIFAMILERAIRRAQDQWDDIILNGDAGYLPGHLGLCDGFRTLWAGDADVVDITSVPGNLDPTNIAAELNKLIDAIPNELMYSSDPDKIVKLGVSIAIAKAYGQYLTQQGNGFNFYDPTKAGLLQFNGYEIVPLNYIPATEMFATPANNLHLYYDDESDFSSFNVTDLSLTDAFCDKVRMKLKARGGVDYKYGEYVVWYH